MKLLLILFIFSEQTQYFCPCKKKNKQPTAYYLPLYIGGAVNKYRQTIWQLEEILF